MVFCLLFASGGVSVPFGTLVFAEGWKRVTKPRVPADLRSPNAPDKPETWCKRCQERNDAPNPKLPLLNPKHEKFCRNVAIGAMSALEAYKGAGFVVASNSIASTSASALKRRLEITNRIEQLALATIELDVKNREWVDAQLREIVERCMQGKPHLNKAGFPDGHWMFDARGSTSALQLMGKDRGMFVEKVEILGIDAELHGKSDKEVLEMVAASAIDLGRDFIKQLGEKVGLQYAEGGKGDTGAKKATVDPVPTLQ